VFAFFVVIHLLISVALVLTVLLQSGKGGGLAGAFGAGGTAQTLFGGRGAATFLSKATSWLAVAFMVMSILLAVLSSRGRVKSGGLLQQRARERAAALPPSSAQFNPASTDSAGTKMTVPGEGALPSGEGAGSSAPVGSTPTGKPAPSGAKPAGSPSPGNR
jgi:preprotein translocase subunit SecG